MQHENILDHILTSLNHNSIARKLGVGTPEVVEYFVKHGWKGEVVIRTHGQNNNLDAYVDLDVRPAIPGARLTFNKADLTDHLNEAFEMARLRGLIIGRYQCSRVTQNTYRFVCLAPEGLEIVSSVGLMDRIVRTLVNYVGVVPNTDSATLDLRYETITSSEVADRVSPFLRTRGKNLLGTACDSVIKTMLDEFVVLRDAEGDLAIYNSSKNVLLTPLPNDPNNSVAFLVRERDVNTHLIDPNYKFVEVADGELGVVSLSTTEEANELDELLDSNDSVVCVKVSIPSDVDDRTTKEVENTLTALANVLKKRIDHPVSLEMSHG